MVPTDLYGKYVIRFVVCARITTEDDIKLSWKEIQNNAERLFADSQAITVDPHCDP